MHRLATLPGDPSDDEALLVEQRPAPLLLLTSADSDLKLLSKRLSAGLFPQMRGLNLTNLQHPAAVDHYLRSSLQGTALVLVR